MEKDIEIKTTLNDRMKEENRRLFEQLQVKISIRKIVFFNHILQADKIRLDEREYRIQSIEKENKMLRETINELETKYSI